MCWALSINYPSLFLTRKYTKKNLFYKYFFWVLWVLKHILNIYIFLIFFFWTQIWWGNFRTEFSLLTKKKKLFWEYIFWVLWVLKHILNIYIFSIFFFGTQIWWGNFRTGWKCNIFTSWLSFNQIKTIPYDIYFLYQS